MRGVYRGSSSSATGCVGGGAHKGRAGVCKEKMLCCTYHWTTGLEKGARILLRAS